MTTFFARRKDKNICFMKNQNAHNALFRGGYVCEPTVLRSFIGC
jgi:hypothetical protein